METVLRATVCTVGTGVATFAVHTLLSVPVSNLLDLAGLGVSALAGMVAVFFALLSR